MKSVCCRSGLQWDKVRSRKAATDRERRLLNILQTVIWSGPESNPPTHTHTPPSLSVSRVISTYCHPQRHLNTDIMINSNGCLERTPPPLFHCLSLSLSLFQTSKQAQADSKTSIMNRAHTQNDKTLKSDVFIARYVCWVRYTGFRIYLNIMTMMSLYVDNKMSNYI